MRTEYKKEIIKLTRELPSEKIFELIDFAKFLKTKGEVFTHTQIKNSAEYVRKLRIREGKQYKSGNKFIKELIEWQKSNS